MFSLYTHDDQSIMLRQRLIELLLTFGLTGLLQQIRDTVCGWLDQWVLDHKTLHCPVCLSTRLWKDGHEQRKNRYAVQRYYCPACDKSCCLNTFAPWYWHKYDPATIIGFLWIKNKYGFGLQECASLSCLASRFPTWKTLWSWLQKFGENIILTAAKVQKNVSRYRAWQTDEMYVRDRPIIGTVDPQTKVILFTPSWFANEENMTKHMRTVLGQWKKVPRGWWTDEHKAYPPAFRNLPEKIPHGTVCHSKEYESSRGICTNAIENQWRQYRRWLFRMNGIKHQVYVDFYTKLYEAQRNVLKSPLQMLQLMA